MIKFIESFAHQELWQIDGDFYIVSLSPYTPEYMIFASNELGDVVSWRELWVDYDMNQTHADVIKDFAESLTSK